MTERGVASIICEKCSGWHPTEAHVQHEGEEREKRQTEIKARPDSAYRFDALGFKPEKEVESWMHEVVDRAKELGDDLQGTDWFVHIGSLNRAQGESVLDLVNPSQVSQYDISTAPHKAGDLIWSYAELELGGLSGSSLPIVDRYKQNVSPFRHLLVLQEQWTKTREPKDLQSYKDALFDALQKLINGWSAQVQLEIQDYKELTGEAMGILKELDSTEGRRRAVYFIGKMISWISGVDAAGILYRIPPDITMGRPWKDEGAVMKDLLDAQGKKVGLIREYPRQQEAAFRVSLELYERLVQGIYVPYGSIDLQQRILEKMFSVTKDFPERRLPIYNYYGKLIWPRPPVPEK